MKKIEIYTSELEKQGIKSDSPFLYHLQSDEYIDLNGKPIHQAVWNLILSKRDLGLWKVGMKPHRAWYVSDVKKYFGLKGNKEAIYKQIVFLKDYILGKDEL